MVLILCSPEGYECLSVRLTHILRKGVCYAVVRAIYTPPYIGNVCSALHFTSCIIISDFYVYIYIYTVHYVRINNVLIQSVLCDVSNHLYGGSNV